MLEKKERLIDYVPTVKELRGLSGMTQKQFGDYFGISHRNIQNWEGNAGSSRNCPDHLLELMIYRMLNENAITLDDKGAYDLINRKVKTDKVIGADAKVNDEKTASDNNPEVNNSEVNN